MEGGNEGGKDVERKKVKKGRGKEGGREERDGRSNR